MSLARAGIPAILIILTALLGCETPGTSGAKPNTAPIITANLPPLPSYAETAAAYNARLVGTDRLVARANIRLTYFDKDGERRSEQPEGTLQIIRPDRLALSLGKAGQTLFWFGCDPERYWWIDLTDKAMRVAYVGRHAALDAPGGAARQQFGIAIRPTDLIQLLGIVPLDPNTKGQMQWSADGKRLGIVTRLAPTASGTTAAAGYQRLWVDPVKLIPAKIELYDAALKLVLVGEHEGQENLEITRTGISELIGAHPRVPARVYCRHAESGTDIRLTFTGVKDGRISDRAFVLDELVKQLGVDRVVDLDAPAGD
jgi:hypothetical protein